MATTAAARGHRADADDAKGGEVGAPVQIGVMWGYPFALVRRLLISFVLLLVFCIGVAWALGQTTDTAQLVLHLAAVALAILVPLYIGELLGVTVRPLPPLRIEAVLATAGASLIIMGLGYLLLPKSTYAPPMALLSGAPVLAALALYLRRKWMEVRSTRDLVPAAVFAGSREAVQSALGNLGNLPGLVVECVLLPPKVQNLDNVEGIETRHAPKEFSRIRKAGIRMLIVGRSSADDLRAVLAPSAGAGIHVESAEDVVAKARGKVNLGRGHDLDLLNRLTSQARPFPAQRLLDIVLALTLLLFTLPFLPLVALAIVCESGGPVFLRQKRVGRWGRPLWMIKFRTMYRDAEKMSGPVYAQDRDPRITRVGGVLRKLRIDEIPQLWNVLMGQMSLVGPRPERPFFVKKLRRNVPLYSARHAVRPGVTGWAQIRYPYGSTEEDSREKLAYDLFYITNRSLTFYLTVLLETAKVVFFGRGGR